MTVYKKLQRAGILNQLAAQTKVEAERARSMNERTLLLQAATCLESAAKEVLN